MATGHIAVFVTMDTPQNARQLARLIIEARLAACVNISGGVTSVYRWNGAMHEDGEQLLIIKTLASRLEELTDFIRKNHHYELPEVIALPILGGNIPYLAWLGRESAPNHE
ncbi:MAG: Divalent-cation tolerance protein CutA [Myxococcota bacterium]|nr:Divalent-cation tolerance protein CutA [Myxococcota bacterium]